MSPLVTSLWITLIGMGLVFIAILLLWGLMEALMRFTARYSANEVAAGEADDQNAESQPADLLAQTTCQEQKKRAAAVAVAIALAMKRPTVLTVLSGSTGSAWRAITRSNQLNQATHIPRKSRGSER